MTDLTVAFWNRRWNANLDRQWRLLQQLGWWDVLVLAEVTRTAFQKLGPLGDSAFHTLTTSPSPTGATRMASRCWRAMTGGSATPLLSLAVATTDCRAGPNVVRL